MSMFTLAISCLTTSNLPWFMDLTFQVPMQYCSLQHCTLLLSPVTSTTVCWFCFGSISSFFLELFLHSSPVAYWAPTNLVAQMRKCLSTMQETWVRSLGGEDLLKKEMATHSSILAWKIPWTEEPGRLKSMGSKRVRHDWATSLSLLPTWGVHHSVYYFFAFSYCSWGSQGKNTEMVCHSLFQWTTFCQNSSPWPLCLGGPTRHGS